MKKLYDVLLEKESLWGNFVVILGKDTEFEALAHIIFNEEEGRWDSVLLFKDDRFSPPEELPSFPFTYQTPSAGNGVLAEHRANKFWETLTSIFKGLMK